MSDSDNFLQKAFYLGIGIAGAAVEKANDTFTEFKKQVDEFSSSPDFSIKLQQMADEMVEKGKISAEEARKYVEDMIGQTQSLNSNSSTDESKPPRTIDIIVEDEDED